jgi:hypothetical protein
MNTLKYTLIADGSSDSTLLEIIKWTLNDLYPKLATERSFADFRTFRNPPKTISDKVQRAKEYFPYDILFIHRDAEKNDSQIIANRVDEIRSELDESEMQQTVCIIPIRMMETWLLINKDAIKRAAGNRSYQGSIAIPPLKTLESIKNSKELLHNILRVSSGLKGRRLSAFNPHAAVHRVAEYIDDYSSLRQLYAFQFFENDLKQKVDLFLSS